MVYQKLTKVVLFLTMILIFFLSASAQPKSKKRGIATNALTEEQMRLLSPKVVWWYNWAGKPDMNRPATYKNNNMEFVPIIWNRASTFYDDAKLFLSNNPNSTKYLLGFNEPNFEHQSKLKPTEAANEWEKLEAIAKKYNLELVSPAVNFCDTCITYEDNLQHDSPFYYMDSFIFDKCKTCKIDYVAFHWYASNLASLKDQVNQYYAKYGKTLWITEFAGFNDINCTAFNDPAEIKKEIDYMVQTVDYLENDPRVFRYSWYVGYNENQHKPLVNLFTDWEGGLTELGKIYVSLPVHDTSYYYITSNPIEAENYSRADTGVTLHRTSDKSGAFEVHIPRNNWIEYKIDVEQGKEYQLLIRYLKDRKTDIQISIDNVVFDTISMQRLEPTEWQDIGCNINLTKGKHTLKLTPNGLYFVLNWLQFTNPSSTIWSSSKKGALIKDNAQTYEIYNVQGRKINPDKQVDIKKMQMNSGIYFLRSANQNGKNISKFIIP